MGNASTRAASQPGANADGRATDSAADPPPASGAADAAGPPALGREAPRPPSVFQLAREGYDAVIAAICRPPRAEYTVADLGPPAFTLRGRRFVRRDFTVVNNRRQRLHCSVWEPEASQRPAAQLPLVIYAHGNSSCRVGALENLQVVLSEGACYLAFDCAGSGMSDGEHVTLGHFEKDDLAAVIDHVRAEGKTTTIAVWGRSMGAATALLHSHRDPSIAGIILDSPFSDLQALCIEIVEMGKSSTGYKVPGFLVSAALRIVRSSVLKRTTLVVPADADAETDTVAMAAAAAGDSPRSQAAAVSVATSGRQRGPPLVFPGLDILALKPIKDVGSAFIPALFIAGDQDDFIRCDHSKQLHAAYAGDKNLLIVPGGTHNSFRPQYVQDSAAIFIRTVLQVPEALSLPAPNPLMGFLSQLAQPVDSRQRALSARRTSRGAPTARDADGSEEEQLIQQALLLSLAEASNSQSAVTGDSAPARGGAGGSSRVVAPPALPAPATARETSVSTGAAKTD